MKNPFRPSEVISDPGEFYGRSTEISTLSRLISQGSLAIQGSFGIGKSSLLSRTLLHMEGFDSLETSTYRIAVGHGDIQTIEDAARMILEELVEVNNTSKTLTIGIPKLAQYSSTEAYSLFQENRHVSALNKILEDKAFKELTSTDGFFIIAIDEAEKCAKPLARLFRQVLTKCQLNGISNIRFIFCGVSPFLERMIKEDQGVNRFIYEVIHLNPFTLEEARDFLDTKFIEVLSDVKERNDTLNIDPAVIDRVAQLSGGHPHLLQLLGSHVIENEYLNSDGILNLEDLVGSLQKICYKQRAPVYDLLLHDMSSAGTYEAYLKFLELAGGTFPGRVNAQKVDDFLETSEIEWLRFRNIITLTQSGEWELSDELLRVRVLMDLYDNSNAIEDALIRYGELESDSFLDKMW